MDQSTPLVSSIIQVIRLRFHRTTPFKIKRHPLAKESQKNKISSSPPPATRPESASSASPPSQVHIRPTACQEDPHHIIMVPTAGPPRPLPPLPHLFGGLCTFNRRSDSAPTYQCNQGNEDHHHHYHNSPEDSECPKSSKAKPSPTLMI